MKLTQEVIEKIEETTLRVNASHRGGGIEIDLTDWGFPDEKMAAYQNYLGGGMLGSIQVNDTIRRQSLTTTDENAKELDEIGEALMRYFHNLTNHEGDEWEEASFEENQLRPSSGY
jgi:hypothetical protein